MLAACLPILPALPTPRMTVTRTNDYLSIMLPGRGISRVHQVPDPDPVGTGGTLCPVLVVFF